MRCDQCQRPASHHFVEIRDGEKLERHLCAEHAQPHLGRIGGIPHNLRPGQGMVGGQVVDSAVEEGVKVGFLAQCRAISRLLRNLGRDPTSDELAEEIASPGPSSSEEPSDPDVRRRVASVERMAAFVEQHGRLPTSESELPFAEFKDL